MEGQIEEVAAVAAAVEAVAIEPAAKAQTVLEVNYTSPKDPKIGSMNFVGPQGGGKSRTAKSIGFGIIRRGRNVRFTDTLYPLVAKFTKDDLVLASGLHKGVLEKRGMCQVDSRTIGLFGFKNEVCTVESCVRQLNKRITDRKQTDTKDFKLGPKLLKEGLEYAKAADFIQPFTQSSEDVRNIAEKFFGFSPSDAELDFIYQDEKLHQFYIDLLTLKGGNMVKLFAAKYDEIRAYMTEKLGEVSSDSANSADSAAVDSANSADSAAADSAGP